MTIHTIHRRLAVLALGLAGFAKAAQPEPAGSNPAPPPAKPPETQTAREAKSVPDETPLDKTDEQTTAPQEITHDPFAFSMPPGGGEFMPFSRGAVPAGFEVIGIAAPKGSPPVAALRAPGHTTSLFVREGDIIGVNAPSSTKTNANANARASRSNTGNAITSNAQESIFIKVGHISGQQVELHPVTNPENIRVLR